MTHERLFSREDLKELKRCWGIRSGDTRVDHYLLLSEMYLMEYFKPDSDIPRNSEKKKLLEKTQKRLSKAIESVRDLGSDMGVIFGRHIVNRLENLNNDQSVLRKVPAMLKEAELNDPVWFDRVNNFYVGNMLDEVSDKNIFDAAGRAASSEKMFEFVLELLEVTESVVTGWSDSIEVKKKQIHPKDEMLLDFLAMEYVNIFNEIPGKTRGSHFYEFICRISDIYGLKLKGDDAIGRSVDRSCGS